MSAKPDIPQTPACQSVEIRLTAPISYGKDSLETLSLRRPTVGDLRGISLRMLHDLDSDILFDLLPRIATPALAAGHIQTLDPADTVKLLATLSDFFII